MDLSKLLYWFVKTDTWIFLSCYMNLSKLIHGFVITIDTWICQSCYMDILKLFPGFVTVILCISRPLPNTLQPSLTKISMLVEAPALN